MIVEFLLKPALGSKADQPAVDVVLLFLLLEYTVPALADSQ